MIEIPKFNLTEDETKRAKALDEKILKYIEKHNIKRSQFNKYYKYYKKLEDSISDSDKNLLGRYYANMFVYIASLRNRIKMSLKYLWEDGTWTFKAPIGYKNYRDKKGQPQIKVDPNMGTKVFNLFKARTYGLSLSQLEKYMAKQPNMGRPRSKTYIFKKRQISRILHNPFYTGTMVINNVAYPHRYPKIVSKELFDEVQKTF